MHLKIVNKEELDVWLYARMRAGIPVFSVKGEPPAGAEYSDGTLITNPVNVAWKDQTNGEVFKIEYEV